MSSDNEDSESARDSTFHTAAPLGRSDSDDTWDGSKDEGDVGVYVAEELPEASCCTEL